MKSDEDILSMIYSGTFKNALALLIATIAYFRWAIHYRGDVHFENSVELTNR